MALVDRIQHISVTHDFILVPVAWCRLVLHQLLNPRTCRDDALNLIRILRTLYLCYFNEPFQFNWLLPDKQILPSFTLMDFCNVRYNLCIPHLF